MGTANVVQRSDSANIADSAEAAASKRSRTDASNCRGWFFLAPALARGLLCSVPVDLPIKEMHVPSVIAVPPTEPRLPPPPTAPSRGTEPFSDLLDSAARAPRARDEAPPNPNKRAESSAPPPRAEARAESPACGDTQTPGNPDKVCCDQAPELAREEQGVAQAEDGEVPETAATDSATAEADTAGMPASDDAALAEAAVALIAEEVDATGGDQDGADNAENANGDGATAETTPVQVVAVAASVTTDTTIDLATNPVVAVVPESEAEIANAPQGAPAPAAAEVAAPAATVTTPQTAPTNAVPTIASDQSTEGKAANLAPPQSKSSGPVGADSAQAQAPKPAQPLTAAPIAADANSASTGDPESQLPQQSTTPQADPMKLQPANATRPTDASTPPAPAADASAPKIQINPAAPPVTPEPVRALAASLNPASLHAANVNEPNPVPLTGNALAVEIISRLRDGLRRFDIRLDPPELGRVDVRLEVDKNGHATTRLTVDKPETLDLLLRDARGLERALQQAGLKTDQGGLEFSLRQQANDGAADGKPGSPERRPDLLASDESERIEAVIEGYRSAAYARGGVDIRI
jgi:chemotaxis protein MotD